MSELELKDHTFVQNRTNIMKDTRTQARQETHTTKRDWRSIIASDICVHITAWLLLTVGLCILVSTFYVAVLHTDYELDKNQQENNNSNGQVDNNNYPLDTTTMRNEFEVTVMLNKSVRSFRLLSPTINKNNECQENNCKVTCINSDTIEDMITVAHVETSCSNIDFLLIKEQSFPNGLLHNPWIYLNKPVYELEITDSNITNIKCSTFNSPPFTFTYQLSLRDLHLEKLSGGVLLGLQSLRFLLIDTPLREIDRAFLQPVQMTLQHLSINSGLVVLPGQTVFGVSRLLKLEYVDLSENIFRGPLTRAMFRGTPNLRYLHICSAHITAIDIDTFNDLGNVLQVLDLSDNFLTTISDSSLTPLLMGPNRALISLSYNKWNCNCDLKGFADVYRIFRKQFIDTIYCHSPYSRYGELLDELSLEDDDCFASTKDMEDHSESSGINDAKTTPETPETSPDTTTTITPFKFATTLKHNLSTTATHSSDNTTNNDLIASASSDPITRSNNEGFDTITLRCLSTQMTDRSREKRDRRNIRSLAVSVKPLPTEASHGQPSTKKSAQEECAENLTKKFKYLSIELTTSKPENRTVSNTATTRNRTRDSRLPYSTYTFPYAFTMPTYTFNLTLMTKSSLKIIIKDFNKALPVNILWFNRQSETTIKKTNGTKTNTPTIDYHCESYLPPHLMVNNLYENSTYTFCVLSKQETISPFDCQPFYVPLTEHAGDNTWISADQEPFTITMLCMIFALSILLGGVIAYFGIQYYPELLEGSDNVLVVKSSEAESNYLKSMGSIDRTSLSRRSTKKLSPSRRETPPLSLPPPPPPPPFSVSNFALERLSSIKSESTCFEKPFSPPPLTLTDDQYELPKPFNNFIYEEHSVSNNYGMSPCSPPPLPKRNSSITSAIVANRFKKQSE